MSMLSLDEVKDKYGEQAFIQLTDNTPCSMCNDTVHPVFERVAIAGCERCERERSPHSPAHFRCNHGAHCTRDSCW